ncbi:MAG: hypothetical protein HY22_01930 [[Candidatus Thermochlorobacteriaceae] bacterium GBChlB]|nr:MAG: hypothetical protein HY22_01930 [[Candidatus Thermochlorobacteriaceae] bacterium GBChlB]
MRKSNTVPTANVANRLHKSGTSRKFRRFSNGFRLETDYSKSGCDKNTITPPHEVYDTIAEVCQIENREKMRSKMMLTFS